MAQAHTEVASDGRGTRATRLGVAAMLGCCIVWGLSPLYYRLLSHVPPAEILAHRTLWSLLFFLFVLQIQGRIGALPRALSTPGKVFWTACAAAMISANWFFFIYAVQVELVRQASLGYYIFPLVSVALGFFVLGERLSRVQLVSVALAALALVTLTVGLGGAPWISLILGVSFALYGLIKAQVSAGAVVSVTAEVALLAPVAGVWLWVVGGVPDLTTLCLLMLSGPLTAVPLMLFSYAAKRIRLSTMGVLQYVNPSLQFGLAALILSEPISTPHLIAFPLVWLALALYSVSSIQEERKARRQSLNSGTVRTEV